MKWHPDRSDDTAEAKERFHQAALAYRILSERGGRVLAGLGTGPQPGTTRGTARGVTSMVTGLVPK